MHNHRALPKLGGSPSARRLSKLAVTLILLAGAAGAFAALQGRREVATSPPAPGRYHARHTRSAPPADGGRPINKSPPSLMGSARVGGRLTVSTGTWANASTSYGYQWRKCNLTGSSCTAITGASGRSYSPVPSELGERLVVQVTAHNAAGSSAAHSALTRAVYARHNTYVAQSPRGHNSGFGCANAHSVAWLDNPAHWASGPGMIAAGTMVHLCGTISSPLTMQGSGTASEPIMIYFQPGARVAMPVCPGRGDGCIDTNKQSYISLDGGADGRIENTEDGTALAQHVGNSYGIEALDCTGCTIEHLTLANLYVHSSVADSMIDAGENQGINFSGSHLTIAHNTLHDVGWALVSEWSSHAHDVSINHNDVYRIDHGFASTAAFSGGSIGPVYIYQNHFHEYANWDTTTDAYHHDGIHCYSADAVGYTPHYNGLYIYDNRFGGATGRDMTAQIFLEGGSGRGATPCADGSSQIWIFDNVASATAPLANGIFGIYSGAPRVYNNTLIGPGTSEGTCYRSMPPATSAVFENNLLTSCNALIVSTTHVFAQLDHNVYAKGGDNAFVCRSHYYPPGDFARWRSCIGADRHSRTVQRVNLSESGLPGPGSRATAGGTNLTSVCKGALAALCRSIDGHARRRSGAWSVGAY